MLINDLFIYILFQETKHILRLSYLLFDITFDTKMIHFPILQNFALIVMD